LRCRSGQAGWWRGGALTHPGKPVGNADGGALAIADEADLLAAALALEAGEEE
jgi:hypothetical protein